MRNDNAKSIALGGVFAALAVVVMCLGGIVPIATYACPVLCMLIGGVLLRICGARIAWVWYGAVAVLSLLLCADKEAAIVFAVLGYYPILKLRWNAVRFAIVWKLLYFNATVIVLYTGLLYLIGMSYLLSEFYEFGFVGLFSVLLLGNLTFWLLDKLLDRINSRC